MGWSPSQPSAGADPTDTLILHFLPPELGGNSICGLGHPVCGHLFW